MKAVKCPICHGTGEIREVHGHTYTGTYNKTCHGCLGRGWVEVNI